MSSEPQTAGEAPKVIFKAHCACTKGFFHCSQKQSTGWFARMLLTTKPSAMEKQEKEEYQEYYQLLRVHILQC
jgi:hypothetical protein